MCIRYVMFKSLDLIGLPSDSKFGAWLTQEVLERRCGESS